MRILEQEGIAYDTLAYTYDPQDLDVRKIAQENQLPIEQIYKTLAAWGDKTGLVVAVVPGHMKLRRKALAQATGNKKISLVPLDKLQALTGYIRGGCSPIGMKAQPPVFVDATAEALGYIWVNAGVRGILIGLRTDALLQASRGSLLDMSDPIPTA